MIDKIKEIREFCDWCEEKQNKVETLENTCKNWYEEFHKLRRKKERLQDYIKDFLRYVKEEDLIEYFRESKDLKLANKLEDFVNKLESQV